LLDEGFRYRDLETGSFITKDPAGFVDGPNLYTYVRQNPWTSFDPEGLDEQTISAQADPNYTPPPNPFAGKVSLNIGGLGPAQQNQDEKPEETARDQDLQSESDKLKVPWCRAEEQANADEQQEKRDTDKDGLEGLANKAYYGVGHFGEAAAPLIAGALLPEVAPEFLGGEELFGAGSELAAAETTAGRFSQLRAAATFLRDEAGITSSDYRRQIIESFGSDMRVESYGGQAYQYSGVAGSSSRYLTPTSLSNPVQQLALPPSNPATLLQQYSVSPTRALMGTAAPQNFEIPLSGGAQQMFIPSRSLLTPTLPLP